MVNYYELGKNKQLNEIVVAGSHDAGITSPGGNVRTQALDIGDQAKAGVRVLDLRIAAAKVHGVENKAAELRAFHADGKLMKNQTKTRYLEDVGRTVSLKRTTLRGGAFGMDLVSMLDDARAFVEGGAGATEFLILKFDKCLNWALIAEACTEILGPAIYTDGGNLNTKRLKDLKGHVIVLFSGSGADEAGAAGYGPAQGILRFKNLQAEGSGGYNSTFDGLQYYGKGGTSVAKPFNKRAQNEKKQTKLMTGGKAMGNPEVMGMMYWTSTGLLESIEKRNEKMWDPPNIARLKEMWRQGMGDVVSDLIPLDPPDGSVAVGALRKRFIPNIVMIDFADKFKCKQIRALNDAPIDALVDLDDDL